MADRCSADKIPRILNVPPPAVRHSSSMAHSPEIPSDSPEEPPAALPCTDESAIVARSRGIMAAQINFLGLIIGPLADTKGRQSFFYGHIMPPAIVDDPKYFFFC